MRDGSDVCACSGHAATARSATHATSDKKSRRCADRRRAGCGDSRRDLSDRRHSADFVCGTARITRSQRSTDSEKCMFPKYPTRYELISDAGHVSLVYVC